MHCDFGQATANMMITAVDLGIGSGHSAVEDQQKAQHRGYEAGPSNRSDTGPNNDPGYVRCKP